METGTYIYYETAVWLRDSQKIIVFTSSISDSKFVLYLLLQHVLYRIRMIKPRFQMTSV